MASKKFEIEPLFEETLDFSELNGIKGGTRQGDWVGCIGLINCSCSGGTNTSKGGGQSSSK